MLKEPQLIHISKYGPTLANEKKSLNCKLNYTLKLKIVSIEFEIEDSQYSMRHKESGEITETDEVNFSKVLPQNFKPSRGQYRKSIKKNMVIYLPC